MRGIAGAVAAAGVFVVAATGCAHTQLTHWTFIVDRVGTIESWGYSEAAKPDLLQRTVMGPS